MKLPLLCWCTDLGLHVHSGVVLSYRQGNGLKLLPAVPTGYSCEATMPLRNEPSKAAGVDPPGKLRTRGRTVGKCNGRPSVRGNVVCPWSRATDRANGSAIFRAHALTGRRSSSWGQRTGCPKRLSMQRQACGIWPVMSARGRSSPLTRSRLGETLKDY